MAEDSTPSRGQKRFDWDRVVAMSALLVSVATVAFLGYQTVIMRAQIEAAVWPHIQIGTSCCRDGFHIDVQNKGVGPAIIKYAVVKVDGKPMRTWREALTALLHNDPGDYDTDALSRRVLAANDTVRALDVKSPDLAVKIAGEAGKGRLTGELCYCSVLEECWRATTYDRKTEPACPVTPPTVSFDQ